MSDDFYDLPLSQIAPTLRFCQTETLRLQNANTQLSTEVAELKSSALLYEDLKRDYDALKARIEEEKIASITTINELTMSKRKAIDVYKEDMEMWKRRVSMFKMEVRIWQVICLSLFISAAVCVYELIQK